MSQVAPAGQACFRHPDRPTRVRCSSCDRPICPQCMRQSAVGQKCPECARQSPHAARPGSRRYGRAAAAGISTAAVVGVLIGTGFIGPWGILMPLLAGFVVGHVVSRTAGGLGGSMFQAIAALSTVTGVALGVVLVTRSLLLLYNVRLLIFMVLAAGVAAVRVGR